MYFLRMLVLGMVLFSSEASSEELNRFGFTHAGQPINPKCVNLLQPWMSDYGIIVRSLVIDTCQDSNLAFEGRENVSLSDDGTVSYYEDPNDGHTYFGYKVLGVTQNNIYVLQHMGELGFYKLEKMELKPYFNEQTEMSTVLTKLSSDDSYCFVSASIENNIAVITRSKREGKWCTVDEYSMEYDLNAF